MAEPLKPVKLDDVMARVKKSVAQLIMGPLAAKTKTELIRQVKKQLTSVLARDPTLAKSRVYVSVLLDSNGYVGCEHRGCEKLNKWKRWMRALRNGISWPTHTQTGIVTVERLRGKVTVGVQAKWVSADKHDRMLIHYGLRQPRERRRIKTQVRIEEGDLKKGLAALDRAAKAKKSKQPVP